MGVLKAGLGASGSWKKLLFIFSGRKGKAETPREFGKYPRQPQSSTNASNLI